MVFVSLLISLLLLLLFAQDAINRIQDLLADGTLTGDSQSTKGIFLMLLVQKMPSLWQRENSSVIPVLRI